MRGAKLAVLFAVALAALAGWSCNDDLDDAEGADVVLEVLTFDNPTVTTTPANVCSLATGVGCAVDADCASVNGGTCETNPSPPPTDVCSGAPSSPCVDDDDCMSVNGGSCTTGCAVEIQNWEVSARNVPLNAVATTSPFNDIVVESVTVRYTLTGDAAPSLERTIGVGGVVIPVNETTSFTFSPLAFQDVEGFVGQTVDLSMTVNARTLGGERVSTVGAQPSAQLFVEDCLQ
jgi:hypothetical protein